MNLVGFNFVNKRDEQLTNDFLNNPNIKKYILGINKLSKSVLKHIKVEDKRMNR